MTLVRLAESAIRLDDLREKMGRVLLEKPMTEFELAEAIGISRTALRKFTKGDGTELKVLSKIYKWLRGQELERTGYES